MYTQEWLERSKWLGCLRIVFWIEDADQRVVANEVDLNRRGRVEPRGGDGCSFVEEVRMFGQADIDGRQVLCRRRIVIGIRPSGRSGRGGGVDSFLELVGEEGHHR